MDMNLQKYRAFLKTVEYGSFTKAADAPVSYTHLDASEPIGLVV